MRKPLKRVARFFEDCVDALAADERERICQVCAKENVEKLRWLTYLASGPP